VAEFTPAVLRLQGGDCTTGSVEIISLTGGLLCLPKPIHRGSRVKLMFLSHSGPVLGTAEMLTPVSWTRQPFRFLSLSYGDQRRLHAATGSPAQTSTPPHGAESSRIVDHEQEWIDKYRAAMAHRKEPQPGRFLKIVLGAGMLATLSLGYIVYIASLHLK